MRACVCAFVRSCVHACVACVRCVRACVHIICLSSIKVCNFVEFFCNEANKHLPMISMCIAIS